MTQINQLTADSTVSAGDQFPIWSAANGDTRRVSGTALQAFVLDGLQQRPLVTTYAAPTATGFTVNLFGTDDVWLVLTPSAGYAAGTIVLPSAPVDRQIVQVACSQAVTALTVSGGTVRGAPTTLAANGFFTMRFDDVTNVWVRVG
jgi:hypothetical protein